MLAPLANLVGVRWPGMGNEGGDPEISAVGQPLPTIEAGFALPATVTAAQTASGPSGKDAADVQGALRGLRVKAAASEASRPTTRPCGAFFFTPCMGGDGLQVDRYTVTTAVPSEGSKAAGSVCVSPIRALGLSSEDGRSLSRASRGSRATAHAPSNSSFAISDHSSGEHQGTSGGSFMSAQELLTQAILKGGLDELKEAIEEAVRQGLTGKELRRARDAVLAIEATDQRKRAELSVDEAIESDDWWKLQASMQTIVGAGFGNSDMVTRLREAMRIHRKRREVVHALARSAAARDATGLRTALEAALLSHAPEADVAAARCALRTLHQRTTTKEELRRVLSSSSRNLSLQKLQEALAVARSCNFGQPPLPPLGLDPEEGPLLEELQSKIGDRSRKHLESLLARRDLEAVTKSLEDVDKLCLGPDALQTIRERVSSLRTVLGLNSLLQEALKDGSEVVLREALAAVETAGMAGRDVLEQEVELDASLKEVTEAVVRIEEKSRRVSAAAGALQELRAIVATDDAKALSKALARADASGVLVNADVTRARERLRQLRTKDSAGQELQDAIRAANLYRLRAALPVAVAHGVAEKDIAIGKEALVSLEVQARQNRERESTAELHTWKGKIGVPYEASTSRKAMQSSENQRLQVVAKQERQRAAMEELRSTLAQRRPDTSKLQSAAKAAADATAAVLALCPETQFQMAASEREVEAALEKLRALELANKARQQLQSAVASADLLTLRRTVKQVQMASEEVLKDSALQFDLSRAKNELEAATARAAAREELRLARLAGSRALLSSAVRAARKAGLAECEYEEDAVAISADELAGTARDHRSFSSTPKKEALPTLLMSPFSKYQSPASSFKAPSCRSSPASPETVLRANTFSAVSPSSRRQMRPASPASGSRVSPPRHQNHHRTGDDSAKPSELGAATIAGDVYSQTSNFPPSPPSLPTPAQPSSRPDTPRRVRFCEEVAEIPE